MHVRSGAMPDPQMDDAGALSTATIFDHAVYCAEALGLAGDEGEAKLDEELVMVATERGIEDPARFLCEPHNISRALSTVTLDSDRRSSVSIHSQETQSTSFTSAPSRTSRDQPIQTERLPVMRTPPRPARTSPVAEHQSPAIDVSPTRLEPRLTSPAPSTAQSVLSDSDSQVTPVPRRKRTSGFFGMFRKSSSVCTSQSHRDSRGKGRGLKMNCGHSLPPYAILMHIHEAQQGDAPVEPHCCGTPLPREVVEEVLAKEEAELVANRRLFEAQIEARRDLSCNEKIASVIDVTQPPETVIQPATSTSLPLVTNRRRHEAISIDWAVANEAFTGFRSEEKVQFERVSAFECNQRKALSAHHNGSLKRLAAQHEAAKSERMNQHLQELDRLEEMQVIAEHDLREAHAQETQNVATALKHMEAYCLGSDLSHPDHHHVVTQEDFNKLDRQRMTQQNLPRKHENAINVLRARQERDTHNKLQKQQAELSIWETAREVERATQESEHAKEMERLEALIDQRRKRLMRRWDLKFEMWRRDWEAEHQTTLTLSLEHETWPLQPTTTITPIPESSSLAPYVQAAA